MRKFAIVPSTVTSLRLAALPFFYSLFSMGNSFSCLCLLVFCGAADFLDGFLARKLHVTTKFGAYFDATIDFVLIFGVFAVFNASGFYPLWLLVLIAFSFAQFMATSLLSKKLYDPIGKYLGSALLIGVALTLLLPLPAMFYFVQYAYAGFFLVSFGTRIASLLWPQFNLHIIAILRGEK